MYIHTYIHTYNYIYLTHMSTKQVTLPKAVDLLETFKEGLFYMQDPSTLLAVHALDPQVNQSCHTHK